MNLAAIQSALRDRNLDAWLFYDHHHRDPIAYRILGLSENLMVTRRWFYLIPAEGDPQKLVHKIESGHLDSLPGTKRCYAAYQELFDGLKHMLASHRDIAMQYSPNNGIFTISLVDGGTLELVRGLGKNILSSGDLVARFEATLSEEQIKSHFAARDAIDKITAAAFQEIGQRARNRGTDEFEMQQWIREAFRRENLVTSDGPVVAVNQNSGNPHYEPTSAAPAPMKEGDFVLLDIWAKKDVPNAVYYDVTWTGFIGSSPSPRILEVFRTVRDARDAGAKFVRESIAAGETIAGYQVDQVVRSQIKRAGLGSYFVHRTGHSISTEVHANGANLDDLEVHDERRILANSCFSIEPGVYFPEFGVRSEINMLVRNNGAEVTGRMQNEVVSI
jgi:Xaa-Pro dipeptidase